MQESGVKNGFGRYALPLLILAAAGYFLFKVHEILLPFVLGAALAYLLSPAVRFFEVRGFRRAPAASVIFGALLLFCAGGTYFGVARLGREAARAGHELPLYVSHGQRLLQQLEQWSRSLARGVPLAPVFLRPGNSSLMRELAAHWRTLSVQALRQTPSLASHLAPFFELFFLVPFIAFLFMLEAPAFFETALGGIPARYVEMALNIVVEIDNALGQYVRGICLKSLLVSLLALAGFWIIGLAYPVQLALITGLTNLIPGIGPLLAGILAIGVSLFQWGTLEGVLKVAGVCLLLRAADDGVLQVLVFKNSVEIHPLWILFSLMAGAALWGFWGLLFAVPLACMVKVLLEVLWRWYRSEYGLQAPRAPEQTLRIPLI